LNYVQKLYAACPIIRVCFDCRDLRRRINRKSGTRVRLATRERKAVYLAQPLSMPDNFGFGSLTLRLSHTLGILYL